MNTFAKNLKKAMEESGISFRDLQKITGISYVTIQRYASGTTDKVPLSKAVKLAAAFGRDPLEFTGLYDPKKTPVSDDVDERAREFIDLFSALSPADQDMIISLLRKLAEK